MAGQFGPKREILMGGKQGAGPKPGRAAYKKGGKVAPPKGAKSGDMKAPFGKKGC